MTGDSDHQSPDELTARIVQRLRDVEIRCEIVNLVPLRRLCSVGTVSLSSSRSAY
jgi:hypothetical protein